LDACSGNPSDAREERKGIHPALGCYKDVVLQNFGTLLRHVGRAQFTRTSAVWYRNEPLIMKRSRDVECAILYALCQKPRAAMYLGFVAVCSKTTSVHARFTPVPRSVCQQERFAVLVLQPSPSLITGTRICLFSLNRAFGLRRQRMAIHWAINSFQVGIDHNGQMDRGSCCLQSAPHPLFVDSPQLRRGLPIITRMEIPPTESLRHIVYGLGDLFTKRSDRALNYA
jgi:hypothetical protein